MRQFREQLEQLFQKLVMMGGLAESMIGQAMRVLQEGDEGLADEVRASERRINDLQVEVDDQAVRLTALQQPVAADVRFLFMASRIGGELERIADHAINICQSAHFVLQEGPPAPPLMDLTIMAEVVQRMVREAVGAVMGRDVALATGVLETEAGVDTFRDRIFLDLLEHIRANPASAQRAMSLILIARNLERIGDHATNIAEEVVYWIQGRDIRHGKALDRSVGSAGEVRR